MTIPSSALFCPLLKSARLHPSPFHCQIGLRKFSLLRRLCVLDILTNELHNTMEFMGTPILSDISSDSLRGVNVNRKPCTKHAHTRRLFHVAAVIYVFLNLTSGYTMWVYVRANASLATLQAACESSAWDGIAGLNRDHVPRLELA